MFPTEDEVAARLRALRARRDALDREIADLALYGELGRRLARPAAPAPDITPARPDPVPSPEPSPEPLSDPLPIAAPRATAPRESDDVAASRRYGRALLAAAIEILHAAGRPLHAGEIWQDLAAQGFALPGHDPVAALNTRLWKRSAPGGPLRRLGEAVYAPAEEDEA